MQTGGLDDLIDGARVIVCLGPGGVGKTTAAAALAAAAALRGRHAAVLTVDPAARLRDALELPGQAGALHDIPLPEGVDGSLAAMVLDAKGLFDALVCRLAPSAALADRILANPVYRNIAGAFAGADAYMALEQLLDVAAQRRFDLIVVDTPPATHALELFDAPERILALLNSRALEYLSEPVRILGVASSRLARGLLSAVLSGLERMTGLSLLRDVSALASDFGSVAGGFRQRAEAIQSLLREAETRYVLVAAPDPERSRDVLALAAELGRLGIEADGVIINRIFSLSALAASERPERTVQGVSASPMRESPALPAGLRRKLARSVRELEALTEGQRQRVEELRAGLARLGPPPWPRRAWIELPASFPAPTSREAILALAATFPGDAEVSPGTETPSGAAASSRASRATAKQPSARPAPRRADRA